MKKYHVYGLGNALVDKEFEVQDEFFAHESIQKGVMTLVDGESQETLLQDLWISMGLRNVPAVVLQPTPCMLFPSLVAIPIMPARYPMTSSGIFTWKNWATSTYIPILIITIGKKG